ncbi:30S ribosomal protein S6 alpha, chloroplastic [Argentina anserina]|uniref:30S ribosomal protein S6 alpha, chloroplastic n=1 Tax=Argentina anserina TaxID=57926 RepID=UPI0021764D80|nr:30S ribosomal protein S6 alpha, chloroplastic [Potentilla anserina]
MAASTSSLISTASNFHFCPTTLSQIPSLPQALSFPLRTRPARSLSLNVQSLEFSGSFFEGGGFQSEDDPNSPSGPGLTAVEDKEEPTCPPGLRQYETMAVLRPDMSEDERLALTQKYEELLIAGGGMYVEVFNRGVIPLAYSIQKKNKAGESNTYLDGIYLLFTYFTKPESMEFLEQNLKADDNVIRSLSFKIRKRKY